MEEIWKGIDDFPSYEVSNLGSVRRIETNRVLVRKKAKGDTWFVALSQDGITYSRVVKNLVAKAFVPMPEKWDPTIFDTAVLCTLDTSDIRADIIVWRPRWHAHKFRIQFLPKNTDVSYTMKIFNRNTNTEYPTIIDAALADGVLMYDIFRSAGEGYTVFPHGHRYDLVFYINLGFKSLHADW